MRLFLYIHMKMMKKKVKSMNVAHPKRTMSSLEKGTLVVMKMMKKPAKKVMAKKKY